MSFPEFTFDLLARGHPRLARDHRARHAITKIVRRAPLRAIRREPLHGAACALLHYNLACYFCLLGDLATARERLARACKMEKKLKVDALEDRDLEALWTTLA